MAQHEDAMFAVHQVIKINMYRALVVSVLLYGSEAWATTLADRLRVRLLPEHTACRAVCSGSSTSATKASVNAPSNQQHHPSYDNAAYAGLDISTACHPPSLYEESLTSTLTSMVGRDQEAAPKPYGWIQSNNDLHSAGLDSINAAQMLYDRPPVEGLCLRTAIARTRAWPLSQVSQSSDKVKNSRYTIRQHKQTPFNWELHFLFSVRLLLNSPLFISTCCSVTRA